MQKPFSRLKLAFITLVSALTVNASASADLGAAKDFNGFFKNDFDAPSSTVGGRLALGGNLAVSNYSIGDQLNNQVIHDTVLVGGDAYFSSGQIYNGNLLASGSIDGVSSSVINGLAQDAYASGSSPLPFNIESEFSKLTDISEQLSLLSSNTSF